jgi:PAS domain S-box-containing protein
MFGHLKTLRATSLDNSVEELIIEHEDPIFICEHSTGKVCYANYAATRAYGYSKDEFWQLDISNLFHNKFDILLFHKAFTAKNGFYKTGEIVQEKRIGDTFKSSLSILPMKYEDKNVILAKARII